jgi:hypothetical protein
MFVALEHHLAPDAPGRSGRFAPATPDHVPPTVTHIRQDPQERKAAPFVSSSLHTLFVASNLQPFLFHALPHSFAQRKNITLPFPVTSALFVRSLAPERKLSLLFSCACALFREKWGCHEKFGSFIDCQSSRLSTMFTILSLPGVKPRHVSKQPALRLNPQGHCGALPTLRGEALCYAFRLDELSAAPSEAPCQS